MVGSLAIPAYAQTTSEFGYKLHPEKLLENTIGDLQIYVTSNDMMVPKTIEKLKVVSSDTDIIEILEVEDERIGYTTNIKIKAIKPGVATIALAAQGFSSKEITLEVFNNNNYPTKIMMKVTPEEFSIDGPRSGYVAIGLATTGGLPTLAQDEVIVKIETPNTNIIELKDSEIVISEGEYFGFTKFDLVGSGNAIIFADVDGMKKISSPVIALEPDGPLEIRLTIIPNTFNSFSTADGYAILQLVDTEGIPIIAEEDISFELGVDNPDSSLNTSNDFDEVVFDEHKLVIKKGEYSTFTKFSPRPNLADFTDETEQTFNMFVSVENYLARGDTFTVLHDEIGGLEGNGPAITETVPFLTTGKKEIMGVTYFETEIEVSRRVANTNVRELVTVTVPITAKDNFELTVSSSHSDSVITENAVMKKGENAVVLFGNTGSVIPDDGAGIEFYITDNDGVKTVIADPNGPMEENIILVVEPLIPSILAGKEFPIIGYLFEEEEEEVTSDDDEEYVDPRIGPTSFIEDNFMTFAANELVSIDPVKIQKNQEYVLAYATIDDVGSIIVEGQVGEFSGTVQLLSQTTDPTATHLGGIGNILMNTENLFTVQLLDSAENPVYAKNDIIIELVSNNESVLKTPEQIVIKQGEYFHTFGLETFGEGTAELAILSEDLPLSKYDLNVIEISPELSINLTGGNWNERLEVKLAIIIPEIEVSLDGFQVEWISEGGEIISIDTETNNEGIAILNIIANDKAEILITAKVTGNGLSEAVISKTVQVSNMPVIEVDVESKSGIMESEILLDTNTLILILIPVAVVGVLFILKRMDKLDMITEKIPLMDKLDIGDKFEEIKEKVTDIRNR